MADENDKHQPDDRSTGPLTVAGKERSSRNAITHGARATKHAILAGESEEEFELLKKNWSDEFQPATPLESDLVNTLIERHWSLKRCERLCLEAEEKLFLNNPDLTSWTEADHRSLQRFQRYRTAADRMFKSAVTALETLRANRMKERLAVERLRCAYHQNARIGALIIEEDETDPEPDDDALRPRANSRSARKMEIPWPQSLPLP